MTADDRQSVPKPKVVLVGIYLPGIYPAAEDDVVSRLLATSFLKAAAEADPEIYPYFDIEIIDIKYFMFSLA